MPKYPRLADRLNYLSPSVFEKFLPKMREKGADLVKLHIGDSYLPPVYSLPVDDPFIKKFPYFNRYPNTVGTAELRQALSRKIQEDNQLPGEVDNIMMTAGAANALNVIAMGMINPGEEVLILAPFWPFFRGMVRLAEGEPVEAPFYTELYDNPELDIKAYLNQFITDKTVALYLNTPNNPSGKVLNRAQLQQIREVVEEHNLWLISDEAYDGMTFDNREHISIGSFPELFDRTLTVFTFSKVYMFAGLRLGYMVANAGVIRNLNKILVHELYSPSAMAQYMMIEPVERRHEWGPDFLAHTHELRDIVSKNLEIPHHVPEGAYYLFFSVSHLLENRSFQELVNDCLEIGVSVAPGNDFGPVYDEYIRICFAGESPERLRIAVERLNKVLQPA